MIYPAAGGVEVLQYEYKATGTTYQRSRRVVRAFYECAVFESLWEGLRT